MVKTNKTPQRGQKQIKKEQHKIRSLRKTMDRRREMESRGSTGGECRRGYLIYRGPRRTCPLG